MGEESSSLPSPGPLASWAISLLPLGSNNKLQLQIDKGKEEATYASANFGLALTSSLAITLTVGTGDSMVKNPPANAGDASLIPGSGKAPGGENGNPTPVFLPGKSHGQRSLVGYSTRGHKELDKI